MIAAIYARKSQKQEGHDDEGKSTVRQIAHAREYAQKKGWEVDDRHVYVDDAISGAEFVKRPDFRRLRAALDPVSPFQVLIVSEQSRLGRDTIRTLTAIQEITDADVRIFGYLDDREIAVKNDADTVQTFMGAYSSSQEHSKISERTKDALRDRAVVGAVTAAKLYGYSHSVKKHKKDYVTRTINEEQAKIVRRMFALYAEGNGIHTIADTLNREQIPGPRSTWTQAGVREMLRNEHYAGVVTWGKRRSLRRGGTKMLRKTDPSEWIRAVKEDLRIIPEKLWRRVQDRREKIAAPYARQTARICKDGRRRGGLLIGRPADGDVGDYVSTGFASCSKCQGNIRVSNRQHGHVRPNRRRVYTCAAHETRGKSVCDNNTVVLQPVFDQAVIGAISAVLDQRVLEAAVERAVKRIRDHEAKHPNRRTEIERDLAEITRQQRTYLKAISLGKPPAALVSELTALEARQVALEAEMASLKKVIPINEAQIRARLREAVRDVKRLLGENVIRARQTLRRLLVDKITCTPFIEGRTRGYRFSGTLAVGRLLSGEVGTRPSVVNGRAS
jgi:DNA invertase Pin-like site-specific DNA recombinase